MAPVEDTSIAQRAVRESPEGSGGLVKSADRVLRIFELIAERGPLTFSEVVVALGLPASSTHNLLKTLEHRGYLQLHAEDRRYDLGLRL